MSINPGVSIKPLQSIISVLGFSGGVADDGFDGGGGVIKPVVMSMYKSPAASVSSSKFGIKQLV
jgi:hypothetical protein